jgi:sugar-phosphatase
VNAPARGAAATDSSRTSVQGLGDRAFAALLFDMDGTILSSIKAAERVWAVWATRHGLDVASFLPTIHGVKSVETIRRLNLPGVDPEAEAAAITQAEILDLDGIEPIAGAAAFLNSLPADRWAVVTSAPLALALRRMESARLPLPKIFVTAEDVQRGKPAPDCFLLAAGRLGQRPQDCLVFEDAAPGIAAAEAAEASVLVVTAAHTQRLESAHPAIVDYTALIVRAKDDGRLSLAKAASS